MRVRTLKLKEAHNNNGVASFCSIIYDHEGRHLITASSSTPDIRICNLHDPTKSTSFIRGHKSGVTALALSPNSTCLASGSIDHSVKIFSFPDGEFQRNLTRFTLPIRCLAFNKSGSLLAAAGDDDSIKLVATVDGSVSTLLKGHKGSVTGIAFDPANEYLASIDAAGAVIFWVLSSGKPMHILKGIAPNNGLDTTTLNILGWSPDGSMVAIPGLRNDIVLYDRDTAKKVFSLKGDHEKPVCFLSWSPNGDYMATADLDGQVLVWDVNRRQDIDRQKFNDRISCLTWKPVGNALAVIDVVGHFGVWDSVVPSQMKSPSDGVPSLKAKSSVDPRFNEDGGFDNSGDNSSEQSLDTIPANRKRLYGESHFSEPSDFDSDDSSKSSFGQESRSKFVKRVKKTSGEAIGKQSTEKAKPLEMQQAFQPGSTPARPGKRHFLCYNMLGCVTSIANAASCHIEVDFHDTGRGPRISSMSDHFGYTMASMNESGSVFANPQKGDNSVSTLMYRPFSSWANNSEWSMRFEAEEVKAVALGAGWVAAITNLNFLRVFSEGGLQLHMLSLDGPVVSAAGFKDELAVVTHASHCLPSGDQMLEFRIFNISKGSQPAKGPLPLTPGSHLTWFGFSEDGQLCSYDSKGVLRIFGHLYDGTWMPVFSASRQKNYPGENYWVVGLNTTKLFCVVCKAPETYPLVTPKPILTLLDLSFPLASSDLGPNDLENQFMMNCFSLSQAHKKIEEMATTGQDTAAAEDEAFSTETALDRCILRLIASCCHGDKLARAMELARLLSLEKSLKGAIKLVTALKLPILAERFNCILEERLVRSSSKDVVSTDEAGVALNADVANTPMPGDTRLPSVLGQNGEHNSKLVNGKASNDTNNRGSSPDLQKQKPVSILTGAVKKSDRLDGSINAGGAVIVSAKAENSKAKNPFAKPAKNQGKGILS